MVVPIMAAIFGGRLSVGATLPMLIFADCFAVAFYHAHAQWDQIKKLLPWVVLGILVGTVTLKVLGDMHTKKDILNPVIGWIVLVMLMLSLLRGRLGDRLMPTSREGVVATGAVAGFTTMVSNAAGPVMQIYLASTGMAKNQLMGTSAWYFFILNVAKMPLLLLLTWDNPREPLLTGDTLLFNLATVPLILIGALSGKKLLPVIPQKVFTNTILVLSAAAAVRLILF